MKQIGELDWFLKKVANNRNRATELSNNNKKSVWILNLDSVDHGHAKYITLKEQVSSINKMRFSTKHPRDDLFVLSQFLFSSRFNNEKKNKSG